MTTDPTVCHNCGADVTHDRPKFKVGLSPATTKPVCADCMTLYSPGYGTLARHAQDVCGHADDVATANPAPLITIPADVLALAVAYGVSHDDDVCRDGFVLAHDIMHDQTPAGWLARFWGVEEEDPCGH